jgi:hypothetical protein
MVGFIGQHALERRAKIGLAHLVELALNPSIWRKYCRPLL